METILSFVPSVNNVLVIYFSWDKKIMDCWNACAPIFGFTHAPVWEAGEDKTQWSSNSHYHLPKPFLQICQYWLPKYIQSATHVHQIGTLGLFDNQFQYVFYPQKVMAIEMLHWSQKKNLCCWSLHDKNAFWQERVTEFRAHSNARVSLNHCFLLLTLKNIDWCYAYP